MRVKIHYRVVYDKWRKHDCPPARQNEMLAKRGSFTADNSKTLPDNCLAEGERVFATISPPVAGYNHRLLITGFEIEGVWIEPAQWVIVPVKIKKAV